MVHINRIREKIEPDPAKPIYIETVWGAGIPVQRMTTIYFSSLPQDFLT